MKNNVIFYCKDAAEKFLEDSSVDLFIGHPPYYMTELELNGGDPSKQMQNAENLNEYLDRLLLSFLHMEAALKEDGHMFIALQNTSFGLGILPKIFDKTKLQLQSIRIWDYSSDFKVEGNHTVLFAHLTKNPWGAGDNPQGPFVLTNSWLEATEELRSYHTDRATVGAAPEGVYREMIKNYSEPGDVVADIFAGCGTVGVVALQLGRKFIYNDVSEDKLLVSEERIKDVLNSTGLSSAG